MNELASGVQDLELRGCWESDSLSLYLSLPVSDDSQKVDEETETSFSVNKTNNTPM